MRKPAEKWIKWKMIRDNSRKSRIAFCFKELLLNCILNFKTS